MLNYQILFYESHCPVSPVFVFPSCQPASTSTSTGDYITCHAATFREALSLSMSYTPLSQRISTVTTTTDKPLVVIVAEAKRQGRVVVLFVEGVRTNNTGVLELMPQVSDFNSYYIILTLLISLSLFLNECVAIRYSAICQSTLWCIYQAFATLPCHHQVVAIAL
jgi:hypothetical protein